MGKCDPNILNLAKGIGYQPGVIGDHTRVTDPTLYRLEVCAREIAPPVKIDLGDVGHPCEGIEEMKVSVRPRPAEELC